MSVFPRARPRWLLPPRALPGQVSRTSGTNQYHRVPSPLAATALATAALAAASATLTATAAALTATTLAATLAAAAALSYLPPSPPLPSSTSQPPRVQTAQPRDQEFQEV